MGTTEALSGADTDHGADGIGDSSGADAAEVLAEHRKTGPVAQVQHLLHRYPTLSPAIVLLTSLIVFTILGDGNFQQPYNLSVMLQQTAVLSTLAVGQTLIILTAGVDLAVGTAMLLTQMVIAKLAMENGVPTVLALFLGALIGMGLGLFHGLIVTKVKLPPFIVTLGTFFIFNSIALVYSGGETFRPEDGNLLKLTGVTFGWGNFQITTGVLIAIGVYVVMGIVLATTAWGRHVYATGDDPEAARLAGINTNSVLLSVYIVAGFIYALGAWVLIGRTGAASTNNGADLNLATITAVVIGGTSLFGGRGRILGSLIGALIVTVFQQGLSLAGVNVYYENLAVGSLILIAVGLDQWIRKVGD